MSFSEYYSKSHHLRFQRTLNFIKKHISSGSSILDIGIDNPFSEILRKEGYIVSNTQGEDLDLDVRNMKNPNIDAVTACEIFEHLLSPFNVLKEIKAKQLIATIPLRLWFAMAHRNKNDKRDRHFHEFEDWQFDWLLDKAGWQIIDSEKWISPAKINGIRPLLRNFTPRYYAVYAERK